MDATRKTEDEVCTALHDCDNDLDRAVNMLLEGMGQVCSHTVMLVVRWIPVSRFMLYLLSRFVFK
jgi:hypothetical protein